MLNCLQHRCHAEILVLKFCLFRAFNGIEPAATVAAHATSRASLTGSWKAITILVPGSFENTIQDPSRAAGIATATLVANEYRGVFGVWLAVQKAAVGVRTVDESTVWLTRPVNTFLRNMPDTDWEISRYVPWQHWTKRTGHVG
jgi:hypothetical protein